MAKNNVLIESGRKLTLRISQLTRLRMDDKITDYCEGCEGYHIEDDKETLEDICDYLGISQSKIEKSENGGIPQVLKDLEAGKIVDFDDLPPMFQEAIREVVGKDVYIGKLKMEDNRIALIGSKDLDAEGLLKALTSDDVEEMIKTKKGEKFSVPSSKFEDVMKTILEGGGDDDRRGSELSFVEARQLVCKLLNEDIVRDISLVLCIISMINSTKDREETIEYFKRQNGDKWDNRTEELVREIYDTVKIWQEVGQRITEDLIIKNRREY